MLRRIPIAADLGELQSEARKWALVFVGIGVLVLVFSVVQSYSFNYMGQKLARRVRVLMMAALLRQVGMPLFVAYPICCSTINHDIRMAFAHKARAQE